MCIIFYFYIATGAIRIRVCSFTIIIITFLIQPVKPDPAARRRHFSKHTHTMYIHTIRYDVYLDINVYKSRASMLLFYRCTGYFWSLLRVPVSLTRTDDGLIIIIIEKEKKKRSRFSFSSPEKWSNPCATHFIWANQKSIYSFRSTVFRRFVHLSIVYSDFVRCYRLRISFRASSVYF